MCGREREWKRKWEKEGERKSHRETNLHEGSTKSFWNPLRNLDSMNVVNNCKYFGGIIPTVKSILNVIIGTPSVVTQPVNNITIILGD